MTTPSTPAPGSALASPETDDRVLSTGDVLHLRNELPADEAFELFEILRTPNTPVRAKQMALKFVAGWSLRNFDGSPLPVSDVTLGMLRLSVRMELDTVVDEYAGAYIRRVIPDSLRTEDAADDPRPADATGDTPSSASA